MAYPPVDPLDPTEPLDSRPAKHGAEELRELKQRINDLETDLEAAIAAALAAVTGGPVSGGRLTLTTGTPVLTANVASSGLVYFTPYVSNIVPLYDGANIVPTTFTERTNDLTDNTKNPAAAAPNSLYDLFVWDDAGTIRLGRGPAWASSTSRGAGAGTTELELLTGQLYVNKVAISNGPAAQRGTYVGTVLTDAASQVNFVFTGSAVNGVKAKLHVYNFFNPILVKTITKDTDDWTIPNGTLGALNASALNQIEFVCGISKFSVSADLILSVQTVFTAPGDTILFVGFGLDSATVYHANCIKGQREIGVDLEQQISTLTSSISLIPAIGLHYLQAIEEVENTGAGDVFAKGSDGQSGIIGTFQM